ncbi:hypothetical protein L917_03430 [Phytophthora nicotianae]|uniref:Uncharacterized protein n=2 Tax=Phytophthora nicotianae TaxID=4792 RepID=W2LSV4_PHYNI|nr:hypothetical protein L917_03430 [Phytophthora nicotianae]ETO82036.1 hypothetical protein F444_03739 [Phytophthora nicotianae P1976]
MKNVSSLKVTTVCVMSSGNRKRKADGAMSTVATCRQLLEQESSRDTEIQDLKAEVQRLTTTNDRLRQREQGFDADEALARLSTLWVTGDDGLLRSTLAGRGRSRTMKLRTVTLSNQPSKGPAGEEAKQGVQAARTPRKRGGSGYSSAVSDAGTDATDEDKTQAITRRRKHRASLA